MAQIQAESEQGYSNVSTSTLVNLSGGLVSIALLIGVGVWGYKTLSRDVSEVPVVRAATDPMRVAPEDPGGRLGAARPSSPARKTKPAPPKRPSWPPPNRPIPLPR